MQRLIQVSMISYLDILHSSTVFLYVANDPIIESSSNLTFAPYNVAYPLLDEHVKAAGFNVSKLIL